MAALVILILSVLVSTACLGVGYLLAGHWFALPAMLLAWLLWLAFRNRSPFWAASGVFAAYLALAAAGILLELSLFLMVSVGIASLISWDLLTFTGSPGHAPAKAASSLLETRHLHSLGMAVSGGILASLGAALLDFQISFGLVAVLALLAVGGFVFGVQNILKS